MNSHYNAGRSASLEFDLRGGAWRGSRRPGMAGRVIALKMSDLLRSPHWLHGSNPEKRKGGMPDSSTLIHLAVALDGAGWHPAAWREADARPSELFEAGYWADLVAEAERGMLDFVTIEDSLGLQSDDPFAPDDRTDRVRGRLDAVLIAARIAPRTRGIGFVPTATVTQTEPFHVSKSIATLDYVSTGRGRCPRPDLGTPRRGRPFRATRTAAAVGGRNHRSDCAATT